MPKPRPVNRQRILCRVVAAIGGDVEDFEGFSGPEGERGEKNEKPGEKGGSAADGEEQQCEFSGGEFYAKGGYRPEEDDKGLREPSDPHELEFFRKDRSAGAGGRGRSRRI